MKIVFYAIVFTAAGIYIASTNPDLAGQAMPYIETVINWFKELLVGVGK
ncbi:hypothetical protein [Motilimonas eburnea]|nr:hypothetical protein [Motilimonas eburnea]MCE2571710.1 hypothetical protein [Motilimonas eburnea]